MAQDKNGAGNNFGFTPDFTSFFSNIPTSVPDSAKSFMEMTRRNMQAFSEAQQNALESWQALTQRQAKIVSQFVQDNADIAQQIMKEGTPEEKVARQAAIFKKAYETSVSQTQELASMVSQSSKETAEIVTRRFNASINEIKDTLQNVDKAA
jgi:phasin family protein